VVNQWGRDGNFSSGTRSSGGGAIIAAAVVALLLGGGGGYAGARLLGGASVGDLQARDTRIVELERQVSDLRFNQTGTGEEDQALRAQISELTKANDSLKSQIDDMEAGGS
jgi:septal ring factor EnvC (AmiA/AmiB activator)